MAFRHDFMSLGMSIMHCFVFKETKLDNYVTRLAQLRDAAFAPGKIALTFSNSSGFRDA